MQIETLLDKTQISRTENTRVPELLYAGWYMPISIYKTKEH